MVQRAPFNYASIIADDNGSVSCEHCADVARRDKCLGLVEERPACREALRLSRHSGQCFAHFGLLAM